MTVGIIAVVSLAVLLGPARVGIAIAVTLLVLALIMFLVTLVKFEVAGLLEQRSRCTESYGQRLQLGINVLRAIPDIRRAITNFGRPRCRRS